MPYSAQLARVTERRPRVACPPSAQLRVLMKLHARLVHYVADGVVMVPSAAVLLSAAAGCCLKC